MHPILVHPILTKVGMGFYYVRSPAPPRLWKANGFARRPVEAVSAFLPDQAFNGGDHLINAEMGGIQDNGISCRD